MLEALEDGGAPDAGAQDASDAPLIGVFGAQAQIYVTPELKKEGRMGYIRRGGKVAAEATEVKGKGCDEGFFKLVPFGYVCAKVATFDLTNPQVRLGIKAPTLDEILPYKYAHNVAHGTPLYRSVPTREEMAEYEPYLHLSTHKHHGDDARADTGGKRKKKHKKRRDDEEEESSKSEDTATVATTADAGAPSPSTADSATTTVAAAPAPPQPTGDALDAGAPPAADAGEDESKRPWWQRKYDVGQNPDVKLSDLLEDSDKVLAKRMVRGFYVAIDRTFVMNARTWHKTTTGLIAPADRLALVKPPSFKGEEIDEPHAGNAVAFVTSKESARYELDPDKKQLKVTAALARYDRAFLTGKTSTFGGKEFHETADGGWLRDRDITWTEPGSPPASMKPGEKWIDVNLTRQTLVAFEGGKPVYATLISSGRKGADKEHDHTTPTGTWRIREKHIAATMDGDGAAAGDMPYSIEDVPYIMYFFESYALHGAFWHDNFGRQQSHGCVNLAPLDAKRLFFWSDPPIPSGWHGMSATSDMPGTLVVVHE
jgi:hypothetical protein